jgi:hypothetical protein
LCDLVRVNLETGALMTLRHATPSTPYYRPRVSPDGRNAVVSVQRNGRWRLAVIPIESVTTDGDTETQFVDPDDGANRYDAAFLPGGRRVVCVSDASGIPNLEVLDLETGASVAETRVTSAAAAPAPVPGDSAVFFLALHARGMDLRRVDLGAAGVTKAVALGAALVPAVPNPPAPVDTYPRSAPLRAHPYGVGPRDHRVLPGGSYSAEGAYASLSVLGLDPVGRLAYSANAILGEPSAWRGASITASWRGTRAAVPGVMSIDGNLYYAEQRPSRQRTFGDAGAPMGTALDAAYTGMTLGTGLGRDYAFARLQTRAGANIGTVDRAEEDRTGRGLVFGEGRGTARVRRGDYRTDVSLAIHGSVGAIGPQRFARAIGTLTADVATPFGGARVDATLGGSDGGGGTFEEFAVGGWPSPLVDAAVIAQRIPMPALPAGFALGTHVKMLRASTALGPVRPFYWVTTMNEDFSEWKRVAGVDADYVVPSIAAFAIPAITVRAGAAYSWDDPFRHRVGVYLGIAYRP